MPSFRRGGRELAVARTSTLSLLLALACCAGCRVAPSASDLRQVRLKPAYSLDEFRGHLQVARSTSWPKRGEWSDDALAHILQRATWRGIPREVVLRLLGPGDGELAYREVEFEREFEYEGKTIKDITKDKEPYLVEPGDDRLIYRTGDGYNHGTIYTLLFKEGRVWKVEISAGY